MVMVIGLGDMWCGMRMRWGDCDFAILCYLGVLECELWLLMKCVLFIVGDDKLVWRWWWLSSLLVDISRAEEVCNDVGKIPKGKDSSKTVIGMVVEKIPAGL